MDKLKVNFKTDELQHVLKYVLIFFISFFFYTSLYKFLPVSALEWLFFIKGASLGLHYVQALPALKLC